MMDDSPSLIMTTLPDAHQRPQDLEGEIVFFDDFTSAELDRSKWTVRTTGAVVNQEVQAYVDSGETIYLQHQSAEGNGLLVIHPHYLPGFVTPEGKKFDFISGRIDTRGMPVRRCLCQDQAERRYGHLASLLDERQRTVALLRRDRHHGKCW